MGTSNVAMGPAGGRNNLTAGSRLGTSNGIGGAGAVKPNATAGTGFSNPGGVRNANPGTGKFQANNGQGNSQRPNQVNNGQGNGQRPNQVNNGQGNGQRPNQVNNGQGNGQRPNQLRIGQGNGRRPNQANNGQGNQQQRQGLRPGLANRLNALLAGNRLSRLAAGILAGAMGGAPLSDADGDTLLDQVAGGGFTPDEASAIQELVAGGSAEQPEAIDAVQPAIAEAPTPEPAPVAQTASVEYGMLITDVVDGGAAAQADLRVNDIILSFAGTRVQSFEDLQAALATADGSTELVFFNSETKQIEKLYVTPNNSRLGIATVSAEVE